MRKFEHRITAAIRPRLLQTATTRPISNAAGQLQGSVSSLSRALTGTAATAAMPHRDQVRQAREHPSTLAHDSLRQLQRQYGNRYVQKLMKVVDTSRSEVPSVVHSVLRAPGEPLDGATRSFMEPRFARAMGVSDAITPILPAALAKGGTQTPAENEADAVADRVTSMPGASGVYRYDLGNVRIHTDEQAAESARVMNAQAFTVGNHIVFDAGEYAPNTAGGRKLLAHELAHVAQQTGGARRGGKHSSVTPQIQGKWRLQSVTPGYGQTGSKDGNGSTLGVASGNDAGPFGAILTRANTWQETGFIHQQVGGESQIVNWLTKHYVFKREGEDNDLLQLKWDAVLAGSAKSDDLYHARASSVVWGRVTERTAADPTPADKELFKIKDGGISTSKLGDLGEMEAEMPLPKGGSVTVKIPLKRVEEGRPAPFDESSHQLYAVPASVDHVDVFMVARSAADAYIETAVTGLAPWISRNFNSSRTFASFLLDWNSVSIGGAGGAKQETGASSVASVPTCGKDPLNTPKGTITPTKGKYAGKKVTYSHRSGKHTKVASCPLEDLLVAVKTNPAQLQGELRKFVEACNDGAQSYGSQLSSEGFAAYEKLMLHALESGDPDDRFKSTASQKIGMKLGRKGCTASETYEVMDDVANDPKAQFHLYPV